jgi:ribosomal protein S18 acetylase RimI-like enzyme
VLTALVSFRPATPGDAPFATPLLYDISRRDFDYLFAHLAARLSVLDVLDRFYRLPGGMFSWHNTELALVDGRPTGLVTAYAASSGDGSSVWLVRGVRTLGMRGLLRLAWRGLPASHTVRPLLPGSWYIAFVGVQAEQRSLGIGTKLIERSMMRARAAGCSCVELDVEEDNARAQALYARLGFQPVSEPKTPGRSPLVPTWRMRRNLEREGTERRGPPADNM